MKEEGGGVRVYTAQDNATHTHTHRKRHKDRERRIYTHTIGLITMNLVCLL